MSSHIGCTSSIIRLHLMLFQFFLRVFILMSGISSFFNYFNIREIRKFLIWNELLVI